MALRQIRRSGDSVLRVQAEPVSRFNSGLHQLLDDMNETMIAADGAGLAAPQIGISKRVIVARDEEDNLFELINPVLSVVQGSIVEIEGCLSCPGIFGEVTRAEYVEVTGLDRDGNEVRYEAEGYLARVFQHEIDHLDGVLFLDKAETLITPEELEMLRNKD